MTTNTQEQQPILHDMWYTTPEWVLEHVWITDDQHATDAWRETQWSDEIPF